MKPLVSVIVPVYNAEKYLTECMDSIVGQSYGELEIVCVNDGSEDHSGDIIRDYIKKDNRIKLLEQKRSFAGVARNRGMEFSTGKYIIFLDADDFFDFKLIEKMVGRAESTKADVVICNSQGYNEEKRKIHFLKGALNKKIAPEKDSFSWQDVPDHIFQLTVAWPWDKLYRLDFIRNKNIYFQETRVANDALFVDLAFAEAQRITIVDDILVTHRTSVSDSIENTRYQWWRCGFDMLYAEQNALKERDLFHHLEKSFINRAAEYVVWNLCGMSSTDYFHEFYQYVRSEGILRLGLLKYQENFYYDKFVYDKIQKVTLLAESEYLARHISELNICINNLSEIIERKRWYFPEKIFPKNIRLVLYGYGEVGRDFYQQIVDSGNFRLVAVVDKNYREIADKTVEVKPVEEVCDLEFDFILIAVLDKATAEKIRDSLLCRGIASNKIAWHDISEKGTD